MMEMTFEVCLAQKHKTIFVNEKLSEREIQRKKARKRKAETFRDRLRKIGRQRE